MKFNFNVATFFISTSEEKGEGGRREKREKNHKPLRFSPYEAKWSHWTAPLSRFSWNCEADLIRPASLSLATLFYARKRKYTIQFIRDHDIRIEETHARSITLLHVFHLIVAAISHGERSFRGEFCFYIFEIDRIRVVDVNRNVVSLARHLDNFRENGIRIFFGEERFELYYFLLGHADL